MRLLLLSFCILHSALCTHAAIGGITPAPLFTDNAVFQREKPIAIYGSSTPGTQITLQFAGTSTTTTADSSGRWQTTLPAQPANSTPQTLTLSSSTGEKLEIKNILIGEVWLASGQSNMEWTLSQIAAAPDEIAAASNPLIRMVRIPLNPQTTPATRFQKPLAWQTATPQNAPKFSAIAYFFAAELQQKLGVPVGIINAAWGGKMIEVFLSEKTLADPKFKNVHDNYADEIRRFQPKVEADKKRVAEWNAEKSAAQKENKPFTKKFPLGNLHAQAILDQHRPSCLFNGGISPLGPFTLRGIIWYQGEHNTARPAEYPPLLTALIADFRAFFNQDDIPFYFCQLSAYGAPMDRSGENYAKLREAQRQVANANIPNTAMAVTIDLGVKNDVHFRNKKPVARRLALIARHFTYNEPTLEYSGPTLATATRQANTVTLTFSHAAGLHLTLPANTISALATPASNVTQAFKPAPSTASSTGSLPPAPGAAAPSDSDSALQPSSPSILCFELAGPDNIFHPATNVTITNNTITLSSEKVPTPTAVRYAWFNFPESLLFLYNSSNLPASPFIAPIK